jgi:TIR domain
MLLVCSEASLRKDWVVYEIERAIAQEEKRGSRVIFPIMIDSALLAWNHPRATRIRDVLAADFPKATKGKLFEEQLPRLLEALGYSDSTKA